jgi:hypothetical protein
MYEILNFLKYFFCRSFEACQTDRIIPGADGNLAHPLICKQYSYIRIDIASPILNRYYKLTLMLRPYRTVFCALKLSIVQDGLDLDRTSDH